MNNKSTLNRIRASFFEELFKPKSKFKRLIVFSIIDSVIIFVSLFSASLLSGKDLTLNISHNTILSFLIIVLIKIAVFINLGLYRAILRYASFDFVLAIIKATTASSIIVAPIFYFVNTSFEFRILIIDLLLTQFLVGGSRFAIRLYQEYVLKSRQGKRILVYGAGNLGAMALRQLRYSDRVSYIPVGFIDDDIRKRKNIIHNIPVLGTWNDLNGLVLKYAIDELVVAISKLESQRLRDIVRDCRRHGIMCRLIPDFTKILEIEPQIRNLEISDLLKRSPRNLDMEAIELLIRDKKIVITGAGGSIGSELVRQCKRHNPSQIIALDQSEVGLYNLREEFSDSNGIEYVLCDIVSRDYLESIFRDFKPHIVFHAAAYKHVHMLEDNARQAIINNIEGTKNVALISDKYNVEKFVLISTDKAVKPANIMGATKRVAELFLQNFNRYSKTEFVAVRFGNVLGSSGSVIPKFIEQIKNGGPVTVTHPDITRYFMLTNEAVQLVLQAASIGEGGEVFILDMGNPVKIVEMAENLIYLMGREPHKDIEIHYTGLREGEKINESLYSEEVNRKTKYEEIMVADPTLFEWDVLKQAIDIVIEKAHDSKERMTIEFLMSLVNYVPKPESKKDTPKDILMVNKLDIVFT